MLATINAVGGLTKASKFLVRITPPSSLRNNINEDFTFLCDSAQLPGISWQTDDIKMAGYGNVEKRPYATMFQDVPLTFFNDSDGKVLKFFHLWMQSIYNFNDKTNPNASARGLAPNSFQYPKSNTDGSGGYYGTVEIMHYDDNSDTIITYELDEAYPIAIGDVQVDWNQENNLLKIPVTFTYTYWSAETLDPGTVDYRSETRANALESTQTRIDQDLQDIREAVSYTSPSNVQRRANYYASFISFL